MHWQTVLPMLAEEHKRRGRTERRLAAVAASLHETTTRSLMPTRADPPHHPPRSTTARTYASHEADESFEGFTARYVSFFDAVEDLFELQRGLNNCFSYDLVPAPEVIESALRASRRVNDFSTAVRIFDGIKEKVENVKQYEQYLEALKPVREELGEYSLRDWGACRFDSRAQVY